MTTDEKSNLIADLAAERARRHDLESRITASEQRLASLLEQNALLLEFQASAQSASDSHDRLFQEAQDRIDVERANVQALKGQISSLNDELKRLNQQLAKEKESQQDQLQNKNDRIIHLEKEKQKMQETIDNLTKQQHELTETIAKMEIELSLANMINETDGEESITEDEDIDMGKLESSLMQAEKAELDAAEIKRLNSELDKIKCQMEQQQIRDGSESDFTSNEIDRLTTELSITRDELELIKQEIESKELRIAQIEMEKKENLERFEQEKQEYIKQMSELSSSPKMNDEDRNSYLINQLNIVKEDLANAHEINLKHQSKQTQLESKLKALQDDNDLSKLQAEEMISKLKEKIEEMNRNQEDSEIALLAARNKVEESERELNEKYIKEESRLQKLYKDEADAHTETLKKLSELQKENKSLNDSISKLTPDAEVQRLKKLNDGIMKERDESLKALKEEREMRKSEQNAHEKLLSDVEKIRRLFADEKGRLLSEKKDLEVLVANLQSEIKEMQKREEESSKQISEQSSQLDTLRSLYEEEKSERSSDLERSQSREESLSAEIQHLKKTLEDEQDKKREYKEKMKEIARDREQLKEQHQQTIRALRDLSSKEAGQEIEKISREISERHLEEIKKIKSDHQKQIDELTHKYESDIKDSIISKIEFMNKSHAREIHELKESHSQQIEQISKKNEANIQQEILNRDQIHQSEIEQITKQEAEKQNKLVNEINNLKSSIASVKQTESELDASKNQIGYLKKIVSDAKDVIAKVGIEANGDDSLVGNIESLCKELIHTRDEIKKERIDHKSTKDLLEKENIQVELKLLESLQVQIVRLKDLCEFQANLEKDLSRTTNHLDDARSMLNRPQFASYPTPQYEQSASYSFNRQMGSEWLSSNVDHIKTSLNMLESQLEKERSALSEANRVIHAKDIAIEDAQSRIRSLQRHIVELTSAYSVATSRLHRAEAQLQRLGYKISPADIHQEYPRVNHSNGDEFRHHPTPSKPSSQSNGHSSTQYDQFRAPFNF